MVCGLYGGDMKAITSLVNRLAGNQAGNVVHTNEAKTAEEALAVLSKEARKSLVEAGVWRQEFHGNEIVAVIACFSVMKSELDNK